MLDRPLTDQCKSPATQTLGGVRYLFKSLSPLHASFVLEQRFQNALRFSFLDVVHFLRVHDRVLELFFSLGFVFSHVFIDYSDFLWRRVRKAFRGETVRKK